MHGVKIIIGGGQVNKIWEYAGADAHDDDAMEAVNPPQKWIGDN